MSREFVSPQTRGQCISIRPSLLYHRAFQLFFQDWHRWYLRHFLWIFPAKLQRSSGGIREQISTGNFIGCRRNENTDRQDHHLQALKLEPLLQGKGSVVVKQASEKILPLKN